MLVYLLFNYILQFQSRKHCPPYMHNYNSINLTLVSNARALLSRVDCNNKGFSVFNVCCFFLIILLIHRKQKIVPMAATLVYLNYNKL